MTTGTRIIDKQHVGGPAEQWIALDFLGGPNHRIAVGGWSFQNLRIRDHTNWNLEK
jgi:hypothetical protein